MSIYSKRNVLCAVVLYFALVQVVFGQTKHCLKEVDYCFTITLPPKDAPENESLVHFRLEGPSSTGWLGLGVGEGMGGYLMVAWPNEGKVILSQRDGGEDGVQPNASQQQDDLKMLNTSSVNENNKFIAEFTRPLKVKGNTINRRQTFAYAYCSIPTESSDINVYLNSHDYNGNVELKLTGNGGSEIVWSRYDKLIIAHAFLMSAAWVVIIPAAIFIIRFAKDRLFKWHIGIQVFLSTPVIVAGSSLSYVAAGGLDFSDPHKIIGFVLFLGFFIQLAIGEIHHKLFDKARVYTPWWTKLHWWFGRSLFLLATFQVPLGLKLYGSKIIYYYIYYIYLFVLIIAFTFLSIRFWNESRKPKDEGFRRMQE